MQVTNYRLLTKNGSHIRMATKVILDDGRVVRFLDKIIKKDALYMIQQFASKGELDNIVDKVKIKNRIFDIIETGLENVPYNFVNGNLTYKGIKHQVTPGIIVVMYMTKKVSQHVANLDRTTWKEI